MGSYNTGVSSIGEELFGVRGLDNGGVLALRTHVARTARYF